MTHSSTYYWHVRHQDSKSLWSEWSVETSFTTASQPQAEFAVTSVRVSGGAMLIFFSNLSTGGASPLTYAWDFDNDGAVDDTSGPLTRHLYALPGIYTAKLTVTNEYGFAGSTTVQVVARSYPGDLDLDGDVDQEDFGRFQACYSGTGVEQTLPQCRLGHLDGDNDIDSADFTLFMRCLTGPGVAADPACAG